MTDFEDNSSRKAKDEIRKKEFQSAVSHVLASAQGRLVLAEILNLCQVEGINGHEGAAAFRAEGARAVGLRTQAMLRHYDFEGFLKLYREIHGQ